MCFTPSAQLTTVRNRRKQLCSQPECVSGLVEKSIAAAIYFGGKICAHALTVSASLRDFVAAACLTVISNKSNLPLHRDKVLMRRGFVI